MGKRGGSRRCEEIAAGRDDSPALYACLSAAGRHCHPHQGPAFVAGEGTIRGGKDEGGGRRGCD